MVKLGICKKGGIPPFFYKMLSVLLATSVNDYKHNN